LPRSLALLLLADPPYCPVAVAAAAALAAVATTVASLPALDRRCLAHFRRCSWPTRLAAQSPSLLLLLALPVITTVVASLIAAAAGQLSKKLQVSAEE
jgi:hypothetical protein